MYVFVLATYVTKIIDSQAETLTSGKNRMKCMAKNNKSTRTLTIICGSAFAEMCFQHKYNKNYMEIPHFTFTKTENNVVQFSESISSVALRADTFLVWTFSS